MAIEIVDFPIENGGSFHSYVNVYQRVTIRSVKTKPVDFKPSIYHPAVSANMAMGNTMKYSIELL